MGRHGTQSVDTEGQEIGMDSRGVGARGGLVKAEGGRIAAARRFLEVLEQAGEPVLYGQITIHIAEGRLWLEVRKTFK